MPEVLTIESVVEVERVARELADAYRNRVEWYRREDAEKWAEALGDREAVREEFARRALTDPPDQVNYSALRDLAEHDPAGAHEAWRRVK